MLQQNLTKRRSIIHISPTLPVADQELINIVEQCVLNCPTPFNAQSARAVILFGAAHHTFWRMVDTALAALVSAENLARARVRLNAFDQGYGTVLFFEDTDILQQLQQQYKDYASSMETWIQQANGILQYMVWQIMAEQNIGASLQHYGNLVEDQISSVFNLPKSWQLVAQMPFGSIAQPAENKDFAPLETRVLVRR